MSEQLKPTTNLARVLSDIEEARSDLARKVLAEIRPIADRDHAGEECYYAVSQFFAREHIEIGE